MAGGAFRLPGSTYGDLVNIIMAYGTRDEASNAGDVSKLDAAHQTSVSRNNAFLVEIGVLSGSQEKLITDRGRALALALARRDRAETRKNWRAIVATNEFLQNVVSAVKMRGAMPYVVLQAYIAQAAGQPRNKPVMAGASAIVDILRTAGLLRDRGGELVATFGEPEAEADGEVSPDESTAEVLEPDLSRTVNSGEGPVVNIHLHIRCTADDIEDLAPRLKALIESLSAASPG